MKLFILISLMISILIQPIFSQNQDSSKVEKKLSWPWDYPCTDCPEWARDMTTSQWKNYLYNNKGQKEPSKNKDSDGIIVFASVIAAISSTTLLFIYLSDRKDAQDCADNIRAGKKC